MDEILSIEEINDRIEGDGYFDGYQILTEHHKILFLISSEQHCCEEWGYMVSEDNLDRFIGTNLLKIEVVDTSRAVKVIFDKIANIDCDRDITDSCMFVNLETTEGLLQFAVYNLHNGYYGHDVKVIIDDKILEEYDL